MTIVISLVCFRVQNNPLFFYHMELSMKEYENFKAAQKIHVDFNAFPQHLIDYFELCISSVSPKYEVELLLQKQSPLLSIIQLNEFRKMEWLVLQFREPTDSVLKIFLADKLMEFKVISSSTLYSTGSDVIF